MAKQEWKTINLMDVVGMATNPVRSGTKYAKRLLNVYTHEKPGALVLRKGYSPKYSPPSNNNLINSSFINFALFYDKEANESGQEILCLIQKSTLTALKDSSNIPIVPDTIQGYFFWVRPYWNGSSWINNWQLVNNTVISKINLVDSNYKSHIKIFGNGSHNIFDDTLVGWTIYNKTKNEYARIITCKQENEYVWVNITLYENNWEVDDVVIISRCWIDLETQQEYYDNVKTEDVVFHRVNNDLRIGFGGKKYRNGLAIGYRKRYYQISNIDFPLIHPDILENGAIEKFSKIDGIYLDTNVIIPNNNYGVELKISENGDLQNNNYYFKLTGKSDYYSEQLLHDNSIIVKDNQKIEIYPFIKLGRDSYFFTDFKLYYSDDSINFYLVKSYSDIRLNSYANNNKWQIDKYGRLILKYGSATELITDASAVHITNEQNSFGTWTRFNCDSQDSEFTIDSDAVNNGNYSFKFRLNPYGSPPPSDLRKGIKIPVSNLEKNKYYTLECYLKTPNFDLFEDFEDTSYIPNFVNNGFSRINTENPYQGQWHLKSDEFHGFLNSNFPYSPRYLQITVDRPTEIKFHCLGSVTIYKKVGMGNAQLIGSVASTDYNTEFSININEPETNGVIIYILHEYSYYGEDPQEPNVFVYFWLPCFIDNIFIKTNYPTKQVYAFITGESLSITNVFQKEIDELTNNYRKISIDLLTGVEEIPRYLVITTTPDENTNAIFWIDDVSLKSKEVAIFNQDEINSAGTEINTELGYTATYDIVKGWDKALINRGRIYYLNPYIEKRYENYILVSHIAPPSIYLWDIATFDNFREIEKYDSNKIITIELLSNNDILILKDSSITALSDDGTVGIIREPIYGVDCISKLSVVNINGLIFWCGKEEIFLLNLSRGFVPEPMLKNTIRDLYLAIENKNMIFGIRNRFNTYRIRIPDSQQKTEYLLTENGWVEERKWHYPEIYRVGFNNRLYFLNAGSIYEEYVDYSLPKIFYGQEQQMVETS